MSELSAAREPPAQAAAVSDPDTADVLVIGAGIAGLTLALILARAGLRVTVAERGDPAARTRPGADLRTTAITAGSARILHRAGVWTALEPQGSAIRDIRIADGPSHFRLHFDHREVGAVPFGHILENHLLLGTLLHAARATPGLTVRGEAALEAVEVGPLRAVARLGTGAQVRAPLVVGADGRSSRLRQLAEITQWRRDYAHQAALVTVITHDRPHHGVALEHFRAAGPFAVLPMTDDPATGRPRSSIVWTERADLALQYRDAPAPVFRAALADRVGTWLGQIRADGARAVWPLQVAHARRYWRPRLALVADAAHVIHPIAGQGINLGLRDVAALADAVLHAARTGQDVGDGAVLGAYQRARRGDTWAMIAATDGLNALFSTAARPVSLVRGLGLQAVGQLAPVKRFFMRQAMGAVQPR